MMQTYWGPHSHRSPIMLEAQNLMTVLHLVSCSRSTPPHLQRNERVQLQRLILQRQGEVEGHYNVHPGLFPITTWYKVTMRDAA